MFQWKFYILHGAASKDFPMSSENKWREEKKKKKGIVRK